MNTNVNEETYWMDGAPVAGIKTTTARTTGQQFYWIDGMPVADVFPRSNQDTGKFFLEFF